MMIPCTRVEFDAFGDKVIQHHSIFINKYQIKYVQKVVIQDTDYTEINIDRAGSIMVTDTVDEILERIRS